MTSLFKQPLNVINVGIEMFSDDLKKQHVPVTHLDWTPPGQGNIAVINALDKIESNSCLLYTSPSPRDLSTSRMPSSA